MIYYHLFNEEYINYFIDKNAGAWMPINELNHFHLIKTIKIILDFVLDCLCSYYVNKHQQ